MVDGSPQGNRRKAGWMNSAHSLGPVDPGIFAALSGSELRKSSRATTF